MKIRELFRNAILYHISPSKNDHNISRYGLRPQSGDRSSKIGDSGIFLFPDMDTVEDALMNWLGDEFDQFDSVSIWEVVIPDSDKLDYSSVGYELIYNDVIPATHLKLLRREEL